MSGLKAPEGNQKNFVAQELLENGSYPARVVRVVDWGVQPQPPFQGAAKPPAQMISVTYEFPEEFIKDEDGNDVENKPRWLSEAFPLRPLASDLAKSTARSKAIDVEGKFGGDWSQYLGLPCEPVIGFYESKGKKYNTVKSVNPLRKAKAQKLEELQNDAFFFDLQNPDREAFDKLPKWEQAKICSNLNFKGSKLFDILGGVAVVWEKGEAKEAPKEKQEDNQQAPDAEAQPDQEQAETEVPW
ncbi:MAG: hypothetical protein [Podoviridae sp. ctbj_2]|nr:MAG: hypothetical protein [Podoviridae sp. ctbj_2]